LQNMLSNLPLASLLAANTLPLFGVLFLDWDAFAMVLLYWAENVILGFYNIVKMILVKSPHPAGHLGKLFMIPFFLIHYGGFTAGHGLFVMVLFGRTISGGILPQQSWPCFLVFIQLLFHVIGEVIGMIPLNMVYAIAGLFISHGISFGYNFLYRGEYIKTNLRTLMSEPYGRIVILHIAILFGGFLSKTLGSPVGILVLLVGLKTFIDVKLHLRQHCSTLQATDNR